MNYARYVVQPGDTIYKIARAYNVEMTEIIKLNHLKHPDRIYPGQVLLLPLADLDEPLPGEIPEPNFTYAAWLYEIYAGQDSELTAITTYLYQAVVLDRPEFDSLLRPIAYDEMHHLDQIGTALRHLGVDPRYGAFSRGHWVDWRAKYINYTTELCSLLELDIQDEAKAHHHYLELAQKIPIPEIQGILTQMAADEARHCQCLADAKAQFCGPECAPPITEMPMMPMMPMMPPAPEMPEGPPPEGGAG